MRRTANATRALLLASLIAVSACSSRTTTASTDPAAAGSPRDAAAAEPAPPVKECLLRALGDPARNVLFAHRSVEIAAARLPDGSVRVAFSLPVSQTIVADGRLATRLEDESIFTARAVSHLRIHLRAPDDPAARLPEESLERRARAVRAVCRQFEDAEAIEFAAGVEEAPDGYSVLVERIPYTPGGHRIYELSRDFEIVGEVPGA